MLKTETDISKAAYAGSKEAFGLIVERYQSLICAITYNATGDISLSEDIAQETFLTAWNKLRELRNPSKLRAWLCGIARNIAKETIRKRKSNTAEQTISLDPGHEPVSTSHQPYEYAISREEEKILWQSLEKIPDNYREPMILFYREHQSVKRLAELLELSEDAVKQRLSRGRKMLKQQVAEFVEQALGRTAPQKAFTIAVLAALPAVKADALVTSVAATSATGLMSAKAAFWAALSSALLGTFIFLLTGGYLMLIGFVGFSAYLLLRRPRWFENKKTRFWITIICLFVLALCSGLRGSLHWSLLFALLALGSLLTLHPGCPYKVRFWLLGPDMTDSLYLWKRWDWQVPPKNWKSALCCSLSLMTAFIATGMYIIYKTKSHIAWGLVVMAALLALNFAIHSVRLIVKVWSYYRREKD